MSDSEAWCRERGLHTSEQRIAYIRDLLKKPKPTAIEHWRNNLKRFPPGHIGHRYALEALAKLAPEFVPQLEREPGED